MSTTPQGPALDPSLLVSNTSDAISSNLTIGDKSFHTAVWVVKGRLFEVTVRLRNADGKDFYYRDENLAKENIEAIDSIVLGILNKRSKNFENSQRVHIEKTVDARVIEPSNTGSTDPIIDSTDTEPTVKLGNDDEDVALEENEKNELNGLINTLARIALYHTPSIKASNVAAQPTRQTALPAQTLRRPIPIQQRSRFAASAAPPATTIDDGHDIAAPSPSLTIMPRLNESLHAAALSSRDHDKRTARPWWKFWEKQTQPANPPAQGTDTITGGGEPRPNSAAETVTIQFVDNDGEADTMALPDSDDLQPSVEALNKAISSKEALINTLRNEISELRCANFVLWRETKIAEKNSQLHKLEGELIALRDDRDALQPKHDAPALETQDHRDAPLADQSDNPLSGLSTDAVVDFARSEARTPPLPHQEGRGMQGAFSFVPGQLNPALARAREEAAMRAQLARPGSSFDVGSDDDEG